MSQSSLTSETNRPATAKPQGSSRVLSRLLTVSVVLGLTLIVVAIGVRWGCYRYQHVILNEGIIKGKVAKIGARIEGRVKTIEVEPGQAVAKGEVLLRLDAQHLQATLEQARAALDTASKELEVEKMAIPEAKRRLTLEIERVNSMRKRASGLLEAQKSNLAKFEKLYERIAQLTNAGAISLFEMDRMAGDRDRSAGLVLAANGAVDGAESEYQKAVAELEAIRIREARLAVLEAHVANAKAKVAAAEADMEAMIIRAPEDGRVLERIVELFGSAKVGEPMLSLWMGRPWVEAWVDEKDLDKIKIGSRADILLDAFPKRKLAGRVEAIGLATDKQLQLTPVPPTLHSFVRQNAMVPVRIGFEGEDLNLQLGLSVVVGIRKESEGAKAGLPSVAQQSLGNTARRNNKVSTN